MIMAAPSLMLPSFLELKVHQQKSRDTELKKKKIIPGRSQVGIIKIEPVGNYAVQIYFDDMHNTGIYSWSYLYDLGKRKDEIWKTYLKKLVEKGLSRHP